MITVLVGTDREGSRSSSIANIIKGLYDQMGEDSEVMRLKDIPLNELNSLSYGEEKPEGVVQAVDHLLQTDGLVVVVPEYNGSMPGSLKFFIDHWRYPESFEHRPVCFVGLGGRFGGLRPVEHLQQIFGYRNAFIYPDRVFLMNVWNMLQDDKIQDEEVMKLLHGQCQGFSRFIKALRSENLHGKG